MTKDAILKKFREKFVGEPAAFHDPVTHQNYPATYTDKMLNIHDLESFLLSSLDEVERETREEMEIKLNQVYTEFENDILPSSLNKYEANYNEGLKLGRLNAAERISLVLFNKDGDSLLSPSSEKLPKEDKHE